MDYESTATVTGRSGAAFSVLTYAFDFPALSNAFA